MNYLEPKFRAWIPKGSDGKPQMFYQNDQYLGSFLRRANFFASEMEHDKYGLAADPPKLILLQWTRATDKLNHEVYEGDIVECQMKDNDNENFVERFKIRYKKENAAYMLVSLSEPRVQTFDSIGSSFLKVIGNEFENPELIKGE